MLSLIQSRNVIEHSTHLLNLPFSPLSRNWNGSEAQSELLYCIIVDPHSLHFIVKGRGSTFEFPDSKAGQYRDGLWERDAAELFLVSSTSDSYQEINLSPSGAWWSNRFNTPRQRSFSSEQDQIQKLKLSVKVRAFSGTLTNGSSSNALEWSTMLSMPLADLLVDWQPSYRTNVSACFGQDTGSRRFLSSTALPGPKPDFHQPKLFKEALLLNSWLV